MLPNGDLFQLVLGPEYTLFIWKICNRHRGTVPQKHFFPIPTANHPISLNFYIIEEKINKKLFEPSLNHILTKALSIIEFSLFNIHNNLLLSSKLLMF
jgi:hypothetical protein